MSPVSPSWAIIRRPQHWRWTLLMWAAAMGRMHLVSGWCGREDEDGVGRWHHRSRAGPWGSASVETGLARLLSSPNCSTIQYLGPERPGGRKMYWLGSSPALLVFCLPAWGRLQSPEGALCPWWRIPGPSRAPHTPSVLQSCTDGPSLASQSRTLGTQETSCLWQPAVSGSG